MADKHLKEDRKLNFYNRLKIKLMAVKMKTSW